MFVISFDDPLTAAQLQEIKGDLKKQTTMPCAVGGLQQNHVLNFTLCAVTGNFVLGAETGLENGLVGGGLQL